MIVIDELPFKFVKSEGFRKFMFVACPRFHSFMNYYDQGCLSIVFR
ncbi:hypothetical protein Gotur_022846 [Gossypium turneri]